MGFLTVIVAILCFGIIIMIHEAGHFVVAKKCGIKVLEFSIGMGPAIISKQRGETKYSLRVLPIGGYCAMEGEDESSSDPRAFRRQPVWKRMLVTVAGAVMNLILGFFLIILACCADTAITTNSIADFHTNGAGEDIATSDEWLQVDDRFISINGMHIFTASDISYALQNDNCETFDIVVERNGERVSLEGVKFLDTETQGLLDFRVYGAKKTVGNVLSYTCRNFVSTARLIWITLFDLIRGKYGFHDLSGVVGIVDTTAEYVQQSRTFREACLTLFELMSFITINVGIFNLIPFPALDGGRLVFLIIEAFRRKQIPAKVEGTIHFAGLALLMLLMIAVTFQDVIKIFQR